MGGQTSIRPYWRSYYANTAAVIFVIDSTDIERLEIAADELRSMLNEDELKDAALLVFANKQDQVYGYLEAECRVHADNGGSPVRKELEKSPKL